jgi:hypothetical protein
MSSLSHKNDVSDVTIEKLRQEFHSFIRHCLKPETILKVNTIYHYCLDVVGASCYGHRKYICDYRFYHNHSTGISLQTRKGVGIVETQIITNSPYARPYSKIPPYNTSIDDPKNPWINIPLDSSLENFVKKIIVNISP